ncbi:MAG: hypothetical protein ABWX69_03895 [Arthrobacter sp.]
MTNAHPHETANPAAGNKSSLLDALDLSPQGLADAPASQTSPDSLVYVGNS